MTTEQCTHCGKDLKPDSGVYFCQNARVCRVCHESGGRSGARPLDLQCVVATRPRVTWRGVVCGVALLAMLYGSGWIWPVLEWLAEIVDGLALLVVAVLIVGVACWVEMWARGSKQI